MLFFIRKLLFIDFKFEEENGFYENIEDCRVKGIMCYNGWCFNCYKYGYNLRGKEEIYFNWMEIFFFYCFKVEDVFE